MAERIGIKAFTGVYPDFEFVKEDLPAVPFFDDGEVVGTNYEDEVFSGIDLVAHFAHGVDGVEGRGHREFDVGDIYLKFWRKFAGYFTRIFAGEAGG